MSITPQDFESIQQALRHDVIQWRLGKIEAQIRWLDRDAANYITKAISCLKDKDNGIQPR